jgi:hypothetical protein
MLVLEQSIQEGEAVKVRTRAEAINEDQRHGWVCSNRRPGEISAIRGKFSLIRGHAVTLQSWSRDDDLQRWTE